MARTAVIAIGGNALTRHSERGTAEEIAANAEVMARAVGAVVDSGWRVVVVHGNGPQVGSLAIQQEEALALVPGQPLALLTAMTQGQLGSVLVRAIDGVLGLGAATAVVTHVLVDPADPAFALPTKPIGPFVDAAVAEGLARERGWTLADDAGRGHRRVVPSPRPTGLVEGAGVRALLEAGQIVVAGGGGGVPVCERTASRPGADPGLDAVLDAVVDKDATAAVIATDLGAQALLLVTAVDAVLVDFGTPRERPIRNLEVGEAERLLAQGQFPPGSMGPKVAAAARFIRSGGRVATITSAPLLAATLAGAPDAGTRILPEPAPHGVTR
jgi:carbamate kinase